MATWVALSSLAVFFLSMYVSNIVSASQATISPINCTDYNASKPCDSTDKQEYCHRDRKFITGFCEAQTIVCKDNLELTSCGSADYNRPGRACGLHKSVHYVTSMFVITVSAKVFLL